MTSKKFHDFKGDMKADDLRSIYKDTGKVLKADESRFEQG
jgi:hypothetical protein